MTSAPGMPPSNPFATIRRGVPRRFRAGLLLEYLRAYRQAPATREIEPRPEWEWLAEPGERLASGEDGERAAA